jgi:LMBR1 domain-containing protein 1
VSFLWWLHILIFLTIREDDVGSHPFLNDVLTGLEHPGATFIGTGIYAILVIYLLICCLKGQVKFGLRIFIFFRVHPMKKDATPMNSYLFNVLMMLICSVAITTFCANAFSVYVRLSEIFTIFNVQVRYLEFFRYFYTNNVFEIMLLCWSVISLIFLLFKNRQPVDRHLNAK